MNPSDRPFSQGLQKGDQLQNEIKPSRKALHLREILPTSDKENTGNPTQQFLENMRSRHPSFGFGDPPSQGDTCTT